MFKLLGVLLNLAGVAVLWTGGVSYTTKDTLMELGPLKAEANVKHKFELPPELGVGAVAVGTVLLLLPGRKRKG